MSGVAAISDWHGCYDGNWNGLIVPEAFAHPAKFAYGLISRIIRHGLDQGYWQAGDTIGDCFGGIASGGVIAGYHALNWIGVELEPRFVELGNRNLAMHGPRWMAAGDAVSVKLVQGDSRRFAEIVGEVCGVVSSPPYAETELHYENNGFKREGYERECYKGNTTRYSKTEGQIGSLKSGSLDAVVWIASLAATRANRSARPGSGLARAMNGIYGRRLLASLRKWNRRCAFSRTCRDTLLWGCERSASTWSNWVTKWRRACLRRRKWALRTGGNGCSSWQTARVADGRGSSYQRDGGDKNGKERPTLLGMAQDWPTPMENSVRGAGDEGRTGGLNIQTAVDRWATPAERDYRTPNSAESQATRKGNEKRSQQLVNQVEHLWATPVGGDGGSTSRGHDRINEPLLGGQTKNWIAPTADSSYHYSHPDQQTPPLGDESSTNSLSGGKKSSRRLNALFVAWLMGLPPRWNIVSMRCEPE